MPAFAQPSSASPVGAPDTPTAPTVAPPAWTQSGSFAHPLGTDRLGQDILSRIALLGEGRPFSS